MVERCPSAAMTYRLAPDADDIEPDLRPAIGVIDDGTHRDIGFRDTAPTELR